MKTSREDFEQWARNDPEYNFDFTTHDIGGIDRYISGHTRDAERDWNDAWQACDAHWREKLQSEEMVKAVGEAVAEADMMLPKQRWKDHVAKAALAAISKEMGV